LWALGSKAKLSSVAVHAILEPANEKYVSMASAWELAIKIRTGKLVFEGGIEHFFFIIDENGFELFSIKN
jgi:PIN domain nuclease of toxin-antitoxin system